MVVRNLVRFCITQLEHLAIYSCIYHCYFMTLVFSPSELAPYLGAGGFGGQGFQECQQLKHR